MIAKVKWNFFLRYALRKEENTYIYCQWHRKLTQVLMPPSYPEEEPVSAAAEK